jgi:hypothetical protein
MKKHLGYLIALVLIGSICLGADADFLAADTLNYQSANAKLTLFKTARNLKDLFSRYQPGVDSSLEIITPPVVSGPNETPRLQTTLRKCVFVICKTVLVAADIQIQNVDGSCEHNLLMTANLAASSPLLKDNYKAFTVEICFNSMAKTRAQLLVQAYALYADSHSEGPVQAASFNVLQLQIRPMIQALRSSLQSNGAHFD